MIKDVKSYFKTVANRLSNAFLVDEFNTESELEFWALAAEHTSRKAPPRFSDILEWVDLLYHAPIHFVYKKDEKQDKLRLYRRQVLVENIKEAAKSAGKDLGQEQQQIRQIEEQLDQIEKQIGWSEEFLKAGVSSHSIGKCEHIPLFNDGELWGIYCVGPYAESPDSIKAKLPIVARILSNWMVELDSTKVKPQESFEAQAEQVVSDLGTGTLKLDRIANLMLGYLANMKSARYGGILEQGEEGSTFLAQYKLEDQHLNWITENVNRTDTPGQFKRTMTELPNQTSEGQSGHIDVTALSTEHARVLIFLATAGEEQAGSQVETMISDTLKELLVYRRQNLEISDTLIATYYRMLRQLEKKKERTQNHTPRMMALAQKFGELFGLDPEELEHLQLTARLHDVGYIVTRQLGSRMTMGAELEHPYVGSMIVEALPVHKDVKEGIKTHHEWINGSGTPHGVTGAEIPWTGKIIGLFEFVNEFIEINQDDDSKEDEEWVDELSEKLIERADNQFDMVLVPTAIELIRSLGWQTCCHISAEELDH